MRTKRDGTVIGEKHEVWKGLAQQTEGGYTKSAIKRKTLKDGTHKYVWKSKSDQALKQYKNNNKVRRALQEQQKKMKKGITLKSTKSKKKTLKATATSIWKRLF